MKRHSNIKDYTIMMIPDSGRMLNLNNEFILTDNLYDSSTTQITNIQSYTTSFPVKTTFPMILLSKRGKLRIRLNLNEYALNDNDMIIIPPNSFGECLEINPTSQVAVIASTFQDSISHITKQTMSIRNHYMQQPVIHLQDNEMNECLTIYQMMRNKLESSDFSLKKEALSGYLQVLICNAYQYITRYDKDENYTQNRYQRIFYRFLEEVQLHYHEHRQINYYASILCITPKYLSQIIYQVSGRHGGEWIKDYVILEAQALLLTGQYTVQQVSDQLNFPNSSFFGKYFKAAVGFSPHKYQTMKLKDM